MSQTAPVDEHWAHAPIVLNAQTPHLLDDHLRAVGEMALAFAPVSLKALARLAGLWHDLGKRRVGFQRYIRQAGGQNAHIERVADRDKTHSAAGALWAERYLSELLPGHPRWQAAQPHAAIRDCRPPCRTRQLARRRRVD